MSEIQKDIERLKKSLESHMNWGPVDNWHSKMFDELSEAIFEKTQVVLSVTTLKRFFGVVKHGGSPSITTLDALARFVNTESWTSFKTKRKKKSVSFKSPGKSTYVTLGFLLAIITIGLFSSRRPELVINSSEFEFTSHVLSTEYPNSVVFNFKIPDDLVADSFQIQQYWDPTKTITIERTQSEATGIYYFPGYFHARLNVDGQIAKTHDLFLKSDGWLGLVEYEPIPKYFEPEVEGSQLLFPEHIVDEVKATEKPVVSSFHFIDELGGISGDNFQLSSTIQNSFDDKWAVCHALRIYLIGSTGAMIIPFSKVGCSSEDNLMLNDVYLNGKSNDLSALSADFTEPTRLDLNVEDQRLEVSIRDELVYSNAYQSSMGRLVGLRFKFIGLGQVLDFQLSDQNQKQVLP